MDYQEGFEIEVQRPAAKVVLLKVKGEVDVCTSLGLMESIIGAFGEHPDVIAVDLSELRYMDSAGLRVLTEGGRQVEEGGVRFAVIFPSGHRLAHLPHLIGLHRRLNIHESTDDALRPWLDEAGELTAGA